MTYVKMYIKVSPMPEGRHNASRILLGIVVDFDIILVRLLTPWTERKFRSKPFGLRMGSAAFTS